MLYPCAAKVCLCLDAHNFVAGPAPRADEISRMMHHGHVRPPVPRQPARSLHAAKPNSHLRFGIAEEAHASSACPLLTPASSASMLGSMRPGLVTGPASPRRPP